MPSRFNRGSSVLAALMLVGALAVTTLAVQALSGSQASQSQGAMVGVNNMSQLAESGTAAQRGYKPYSVQDACDSAKKSAAAAGKSQEAETIKNTPDHGNIIDECVAAVLVSPTANPKKETSYKCIGKSAVISISGIDPDTAVTTDRSVPNASQPAGRCQVKACTPADTDGKLNCFNTSMGTVTFESLRASFRGTNEGINLFTAEKTAMDKLFDAGTGQPIAFETQSAIDNAFKEQVNTTQTEIQSNDKALAELQKQIDAGNAPTSDMTQGELAKLQDQKNALDARNAELKNQMNNLTGSQSQDLTPGASDPSLPQLTKEQVTAYCASNPQDTSASCRKVNGTAEKNTFGAPVPGGAGQQPPPQQEKNNSGGGLNDILKAMLGGMAKGLAQGSAQQPAAQSCSSDPNAFAQQQQQYNQQLQQYNYQLQQYNYQQQLGGGGYQVVSTNPLVVVPSNNGYGGYGTPAPVPPQPCRQTSNSNTCPAAPAQPNPAGCQNGTWKPVTTQQGNGYQCTSSWQCVPGGGVVPTAQLSCQPKVADVGMSIAISYSCGNATGSTGQGFDTGNQTSGSTTTIITAPPAGATGANFVLNCTNQGASAKAECSVQIGRPTIVLVANPKVVDPGSASTIGWVTSGMQSCVVSSPELPDFTEANAGNTSTSGMASTTPLTAPVHILLHCVTSGGGTRDATTTVGVVGQPDITDDNPSLGTVTVFSTADATSTSRGSTETISWHTENPPSGARIALWLFDVRLNQATALIKDGLSASSTYAWRLPLASDACDTESIDVCGIDLVPGREYGIEADLYTDTSDPNNPNYIDYGFTPDSFIITS